MHSVVKRRPFTLIQAGWLIFMLGVVWDLVYHTALLLTGVTLPSALDLIGSLGHAVTFVGAVVIIFALLRRYKK